MIVQYYLCNFLYSPIVLRHVSGRSGLAQTSVLTSAAAAEYSSGSKDGVGNVTAFMLKTWNGQVCHALVMNAVQLSRHNGNKCQLAIWSLTNQVGILSEALAKAR